MNNNVLDITRNAAAIGITGHIRPDGDCVGSCMALYHYLKQCCPEKQIDVYLEYVPEKFDFIKDLADVKNQWTGEEYDMLLILDSGDLERIAVLGEGVSKAKETVNIDHHISNTRYAGQNYVQADASSTCEMLYGMLEPERIDLDTAQALYLGIVHDTGVFKHSNTSGKTLRIAGSLIDKGVPFTKIIEESFYRKTYLQNQLLGRCLLESIQLMNGACVFSVVTKKAMDFYGADAQDLDGVINQLIVTADAEVAIFLQESAMREYKVSMRSKEKVDVSEIAVSFGGGGHVRAAGCIMHGSVHDVINNLTAHIEQQLKAWKSE